ncbi:MAG: TlpA disulfide reductase family protein [Candidatus Limivivens sp.]|nr:TlpA disulfide reductase family protein [Candidatus Limivivens sp.]
MRKKKRIGLFMTMAFVSCMMTGYSVQAEVQDGEQIQENVQISKTEGTIVLKDGEWSNVFFNEEYKEEGMKTVKNAEVPADVYQRVLAQEAGSGFIIPESWKELQIALSLSVPSDNQLELFVFQTADFAKLNELRSADADGTVPAEEWEEAYFAAKDSAFRICGFYSVEAEGPADGALFSDSDFGTRFAYAEKIGTFADRDYYFVYNEMSPDEGFTEEEKAEIQDILDSLDEVRENAVLFPAENDSFDEEEKEIQETLTGIDLSDFEATDLNGNLITQEIFQEYEITMVNIWATWCGPCRNELPEIQKAYEMLPENANIISICEDAAEDTELANAIVDKTGMEFAVLVPNEELMQSVFSFVSVYPTTIFVDSEGHVAGSAVIGVPSADDVAQAYLDYINTVLSQSFP